MCANAALLQGQKRAAVACTPPTSLYRARELERDDLYVLASLRLEHDLHISILIALSALAVSRCLLQLLVGRPPTIPAARVHPMPLCGGANDVAGDDPAKEARRASTKITKVRLRERAPRP